MTVSNPTGALAHLFLLCSLALAGCTPAAGALEGAPVPDPEGYAARLRAATVPAGPRQATFGWTLREQGSRVAGRGVARYHAPERLRLDLFGPRNETLLAAGLVGEQVYLPPAAQQFALPSSALLWGALGVAAPPPTAPLLSATTTDGAALLRYALPGETVLQLRIEDPDDVPRLVSVERTGPSGVLESVRLDYAEGGMLRSARYRNYPEFRELELNFEEIRDAEPFDPSIFRPGR